MNGFDRLAPVYDRLTSMVFGKSMVEAQTAFLHHIKPGNRVLILGGGTGWILVELFKAQPDCEVWYVESSSRMIDLAKRKCGAHSNVHFILGTQQSIPAVMFDVVMMNFFLDLFSESTISLLLERIKESTNPEGIWIVTDFENNGKVWQHVLVAVMITFFRMVCGIEATRLPDLNAIFTNHEIDEISTCTFFHRFIKAGLYRKKSISNSRSTPFA